MKIPKLFNKDSEQPKKGDEPQLDLASLQPNRAQQPQGKAAFDSIFAPRGQNAATPGQSQSQTPAEPESQAPVQPEGQPAPAADSDPMGKLALGGLRRDPPPSPSQTPVRPETPVPPYPAAAPEPPAAVQPPATPEPAPGPAAAPQPESQTPVRPETPVLPEDPLAALSADAPEPAVPDADAAVEPRQGGADALAGLAEAGAEAEAGGDDLLDIFRDAKDETEEGSLVKELDNVPISELLTDVVSLSQQLGVTPSGNRKETPAVVPEDDTEDEVTEAVVRAPTVRSVDAEPPALEPELPKQSQSPVQPEQSPSQTPVLPQTPGQPEQSQSQTPVPPEQSQAPVTPEPTQNDAPTQRPAQQGSPETSAGPDRQQMLHVLLIGLSLALIAGIVGGSRGADLLAANPAGADPDATPTVLAYINEPVVAIADPTAAAQPTIVPTPVPTVVATPTPSPSPTPTPAPTPGPDVVYDFDPMAPAYYNYTVESGDSLTSMSRDFGICPDHILWNNPPRTEYTPLYVGEQLVMPGIPGVVHIAEPGDSIASLAARYSVSQTAIVAFPGNHLAPGDTLRPGQRVLIPHGIPPEALLQNADAYQKTHVPSEHGLVWPYAGPVTTYFGEVRPNYIHYAIDIGGLGSYGQPVVSVAAGKVVFVGYDDPAYGNHVTVDHGDGRRTHYAHFQDVYVAQGQTVQQSQPLGSIGCTGASTGTHLHFELSQNGQLIDPVPLLL